MGDVMVPAYACVIFIFLYTLPYLEILKIHMRKAQP